jgi:magnesium-transporting ATPase (P-type)
MCEYQAEATETRPVNNTYSTKILYEIAGTGQRPLAGSGRVADADMQTLSFGDLRDGFTLLGLVGIIDPPRGSAISAVHHCQQAEIRVK